MECASAAMICAHKHVPTNQHTSDSQDCSCLLPSRRCSTTSRPSQTLQLHRSVQLPTDDAHPPHQEPSAATQMCAYLLQMEALKEGAFWVLGLPGGSPWV